MAKRKTKKPRNSNVKKTTVHHQKLNAPKSNEERIAHIRLITEVFKFFNYLFVTLNLKERLQTIRDLIQNNTLF